MLFQSERGQRAVSDQPNDHGWMAENGRRSGLRCASPACRAEGVYLTLWDRKWPGMCSCDRCRTSPACERHVAIWRAKGDGTLLSAMTMPTGWTWDDGWPITRGTVSA